MATIKEVAKLARVSIGSVSRVLNNKGKVSEETRQRVLEASKKLNYRPNMLAQSLKTKRSYTIGLIIENIMDPFFPEFISGVEEKAQKHGYNVFLCNNQRDTNRGISHLDTLQNRGVDGIIYCTPKYLNSELTAKILCLSASGLPVVGMWREHIDDHVPVICTNDDIASQTATLHLLNLGHKRIGFIGGFEQFWVTQDRFRGYRTVMEKEGLYDPALTVYSDFEVSGGKKSALQMLTQPSPPTAVFTAADPLAVGVLMAAKELKIRVPEQLAIVGFNDISYAQYIDPPLTTVNVPRYEMGLISAEKLFSLMEGNGVPMKEPILFEAQLVVRGSCGALPNYKFE